MRRGSKHSDEYRSRQSAKMKEVYADPDLRRRTADKTRQDWSSGNRTSRNAQLVALEEAWSAATDAIRIEFMVRRFVNGRRIDG